MCFLMNPCERLYHRDPLCSGDQLSPRNCMLSCSLCLCCCTRVRVREGHREPRQVKREKRPQSWRSTAAAIAFLPSIRCRRRKERERENCRRKTRPLCSCSSSLSSCGPRIDSHPFQCPTSAWNTGSRRAVCLIPLLCSSLSLSL